MNLIRRTAAVAVACALTMPAVFAQQAKTPSEIAQAVSIVATVESIDRANRKVTLRGPMGDTHVVRVGKHITEFPRVDVGDEVEVSYVQGMVKEIREPTAEELNTPLRIIDMRPEDPNDVREMRVIHAVVTIESIDTEKQTVSVRGPMGAHRTFPVIYPERLAQAEIGDTVIITYIEAMAVTLVER